MNRKHGGLIEGAHWKQESGSTNNNDNSDKSGSKNQNGSAGNNKTGGKNMRKLEGDSDHGESSQSHSGSDEEKKKSSSEEEEEAEYEYADSLGKFPDEYDYDSAGNKILTEGDLNKK